MPTRLRSTDGELDNADEYTILGPPDAGDVWQVVTAQLFNPNTATVTGVLWVYVTRNGIDYKRRRIVFSLAQNDRLYFRDVILDAPNKRIMVELDAAPTEPVEWWIDYVVDVGGGRT